MKKHYEENIKNIKADTENSVKLLILTRSKLDTVRKNYHHLKQRYDTILQQLESQKKSHSDLEIENSKLVYLMDRLNKKINHLKSESEVCGKEKVAALSACRKFSELKDSEVDNLKEEVILNHLQFKDF